ncbi:FHA domain-containing protein, partial [bacterium]|nr:FHA domain-containing protein [bacterium]
MALTLKFISGKYKGGEFPLDKNVIVIGRHSGLDMVLAEDMVSRKHAKITLMDNNIILEDMGSTNGTFVNGNRIKRVKLKINDRILVGTSIAKLVDSEVGDLDVQNLEEVAKAQKTNAVSGSLEDIPLPDVLQLLSTSKKTGILKITSGRIVAEILLSNGKIYHATQQNSTESPKSILFSLIQLKLGEFDFEQTTIPENISSPLNMAIESLLLEAAQFEDEFNSNKSVMDLDDLEIDDVDGIDDLIIDDIDLQDSNDSPLDFVPPKPKAKDVFSLDDLEIDNSKDDFDLDDLGLDEPKGKSSVKDDFDLDD